MQNLNPYPQEEFQIEFSKTDIYQKLKQDFDFISFSNTLEGVPFTVTPRQQIGSPDKITIFTAPTFYYLQFLLDKNPEQIYDLGCGWNIFKKYIPNIIGVDDKGLSGGNYFADIDGFVDNQYINKHYNTFESVFSICALHFHPASCFSKIVKDFYSMIRPGGRGYLSLNSMRMVERDAYFSNKSIEELKYYYLSELTTLKEINFLVVDVNLQEPNDYIDGNIRLVIEKSNS